MEERGQDEVNRTKKGVDCTVKVMLLCEIAVVICNEEDRPYRWSSWGDHG